MAPIVERDPIVENSKETANIQRRLAELEKNQLKLDSELDEKETAAAKDFEEFRAALEEHKKQIEEMKADLKEFIQTVMLFVKDLQRTAKAEDMERLQRAVDYWTPESWATRNDIVRMTKRILEEENSK